MLSPGPVITATTLALTAAAVVLAVPGIATASGTPLNGEQAGVAYEISKDVESAETGSDGSSSSSTDQDILVERVLKVRADGLELEYDLPRSVTAQDRASSWQFPLRVFKPLSRSDQLLNRHELELRIETWLHKGRMTRAACGHWFFTWNGFKIECDPQSALSIPVAYDMRPRDLDDGAIYTDPQALTSTTLRKVVSAAGGETLSGTMQINPDRVRREQAETDVGIAEITRKSLTLVDAIHARSGEKVSGTITIQFAVDASGFVRQRTKVTKLETTGSDQIVKTRTVTEVIKRRVVLQKYD